MVAFRRRNVSKQDRRERATARVYVMGTVFALGCVGCAVFNYTSSETQGGAEFLPVSRRLWTDNSTKEDLGFCPMKAMPDVKLDTCTDDEEDNNKFCCGGASKDNKPDPASFPLHIIVLLYMFLGIAIVCDELFVPALEIIAEKWQLSNDVAGATLMAAGGSAPELFTSLFGAFSRSEVGFSTVVGSAVFNVLFVIGMCAMFTPAKFSPLVLTWWPLARDCIYYIITLLALVIFMRDGDVSLGEALIQFCLYGGYVALMYYSEQLEAWVKGSIGVADTKVSPAEEGASEEGGGGHRDSIKSTFPGGVNAEFTRPSTFRAGVLQLLTSKTDVTETAGVACVAQIKGDVYKVFEQIDENKNGAIEPNELKKLLTSLGVAESELTEDKLKDHAKAIDTAGNGIISKAEFVVWYTKSEQRVKKEMRDCFDRFDSNNSGTIDRNEIKEMLTALGHNPTDEDIEQAEKQINLTEGELNFQDFEKWYSSSLFWTEQKHAAEEAAESQQSMWEGVQEGLGEVMDSSVPARAKIFFLISLPLQLIFCLIPDCRPPGREGWCFVTFFSSICFIGLLSYFMVGAAEAIGALLGIPVYIMGITIIAAGTSVPDLLSSVIVAKQGHGDMAVSSSVGSNIFDVTVGIPFPWLLFVIATEIQGCEYGIKVNELDLLLPTIILLCMVVAIVVVIAASSWQMTHGLGYMMFGMYLSYIIFAVLQEYCFHIELSI